MTIPIPVAIPASEMTLRLCPVILRISIEKSAETGIISPIIIENFLELRKKNEAMIVAVILKKPEINNCLNDFKR